MAARQKDIRPESRPTWGDVPGIVIRDRGTDGDASLPAPRVRAFVYGESVPDLPTLPYGRWKAAS